MRSDALAKSFDMYKQNKQDYDKNRKNFKKTQLNITYNPGEKTNLVKKEQSTLTPQALAKHWFDKVS